MSGPKAFSHTVVASTRRSWAVWEKRAIVDEAQRAASSISAVARRHGITPSLLFRWRRELRSPEQSAAPTAPAVVPLVLPAPVETLRPPEESRSGVVEVEWAGGRVRIAGPVDLTTLVAVLGILAGRCPSCARGCRAGRPALLPDRRLAAASGCSRRAGARSRRCAGGRTATSARGRGRARGGRPGCRRCRGPRR